MHKKLISMLMILILVITGAISNANLVYGIENRSFTDIENHWAEQEILKYLNNEIVKGYSDNSFKPNSGITRAEFIKIINNTFGFREEKQINFSDVDVNSWTFIEINKARKADYINGYSDNTFRPDNKITREEASLIIARLYYLESISDSYILDFDDINSFTKASLPSIIGVATKGYLKGYDDNTFRPQNYLTRAEAIVLIDRIAGDLITKEGTYGYAESFIINENVTITTSNVTIKNYIIKGDLYLTEGIESGKIVLDNVTVEGKTIIKCSGFNNIIINNSKLDKVIIDSMDNNLKLELDKESTINNVNALTAVQISGQGEIEQIEINSENVVVEQKVDNIVMDNLIRSAIIGGIKYPLVTRTSRTVIKTPSINGVETNHNYNTEVTPLFDIGEAVLIKDGIEEQEFISGTIVKEEGEYLLKVSNGSKSIIVNFNIDMTKPISPIINIEPKSPTGGSAIVSIDSEINTLTYYTISDADEYLLYTDNLIMNQSTTMSAYSVDLSGNESHIVTEQIIIDNISPDGYTVKTNLDYLNKTNAEIISFDINNSEIDTNYMYKIEDFNNKSITGTGLILNENQEVKDIDISELSDGALKLSVILIDEALNEGTAAEYIFNKDMESPIISIIGNENITTTIDETYSDLGATAIDNIDTSVTVTSYVTVDASKFGFNEVLYLAEDMAGNTSSAIRIVEVIDTIPPQAPKIINVVASEGGTIEVGCGLSDYITITFNKDTNQYIANESTGRIFLSKAEVDNIISFPASKSFGTNYLGEWKDSRTLRITVANATGANFDIGMTVTIKATGNVKTIDGLSEPSISSGVCIGSF